MHLLDVVLSFDGFTYTDGDGEERTIDLLPGLSSEEIARLEPRFPCRLPEEVRELVACTAGLAVRQGCSINSPTDEVELEELRFLGTNEAPHNSGPTGFPCICWPVLAPDGCGNFWTVDLRPDSREWGPIYFICHDPAVCAYQARDLTEFVGQIRELLTDTNNNSPLVRMRRTAVYNIWADRSATLTHAQALADDAPLAAFAAQIGPAHTYVDLRKAKIGDGFSLKHEPILRHGSERIFAYRTPVSLWNRLFGKRA
jgi:cell wall assembly regulator SMI1